jgi:thiol-disulfide isomerase/thioredoxin
MVDNYGLSEDEYCDDCDDDTCDGDSCEPDKDNCDDGSCEPDKEESAEPSCENVMHHPQNQADYEALVASAGDKPILIKFGTTSCGACKAVKSWTEQQAKDTDCRKMMFIDGDLNKIGSAWYPYKLQYIPTFVVDVAGVTEEKLVTQRESEVQALID